MVTRALLVGGSGHIGSQILGAARRLPGLEVDVASRHSDIRLDLADPATFGAVDGYDVVVNCTDTFSVSPEPLMDHCLERPVVFVETSADQGLYHRLLSRPDASRDPVGTVLLGAGVFPGLSNLLAAEVLAQASPGESLELYLSWSVLSEAGAGACEVMVRALSAPRRRFENGELMTAPPLGAPRRAPWLPGAPPAQELALPEAVLLGHSQGVRDTATYAAVRPALPRFALSLTAALANRGLFAGRWRQALLRGWFRLLRGRLLAGRTTGLEMVAVADGRAAGALTTDDAFRAAGEAVAGTLAALAELPRETLEPGIHPLESTVTLAEVLAHLERHGLDAVRRRPASELPASP